MFKIGSRNYNTHGTWVSDSEIFCLTPNLVKEGPKETNIYVKIDSNDYTL